jgi:hypothetical protein
MNTQEKLFWGAVIAVGIWTAVTPGRQFKFLPENKHRLNFPPIVYVLMFSVIAYMLFSSR